MKSLNARHCTFNHLIPLLVGIAVVCLYILIPFLTPILYVPTGSTWAPVNDFFHQCGDTSFYAATVNEAKEGFFSFSNPISNSIQFYWVDIFRSSSNRLAALLSFLSPDPRAGFVFSFLGASVLAYTLIFFLGQLFGVSGWPSFGVALFSIFWSKLVTPGGGGWENIKTYLLNQHGIASFELVNDHFRYVILQSALPLFLLFLLGFSRLLLAPSWKYGLLVGILLSIASYSYYPYLLLAWGIVGVVLLRSIVFKEKRPLLRALAFCGISSSLVLLFLGAPKHLFETLRQPHPVLAQVHMYVSEEAGSTLRQLSSFLKSHGFFLSFIAACTLMLRRTARDSLISKVSSALTSTLFIFIVFGAILGRLDVVNRFFIRGFYSVLIPLSIFSAITISKSIITKFRLRIFEIKKASTPLLSILLIVIMSVPLIGSVRMVPQLIDSGFFYLPNAQWDLIGMIQRTVPSNSTVLAIDASDVQLLPVYTDVNLFFGDPNFGHLSLEDNLTHFLASLRLLSIETKYLKNWLQDYGKKMFRLDCPPPGRKEPPEESAPFFLLRHLLYDPYVSQIFSFPVRDASEMRLTFEFQRHLLDLFNTLTQNEIARRTTDVSFIVTSSTFERMRKIPNTDIPGFKLAYQNDQRFLYRRDALSPKS